MAQAAKRPDNPKEVAAKFLTAAKGDVQQATQLMTDAVLDDPDLYRRIMDPLVRTACYDYIAALSRRNRRTIWNTPQPSEAAERGRVLSLAGGIVNALMEMPILGGLRLGEATRPQVTHAAEFFQHQGADMIRKASFLRLVAQHVPDRKKVRDVLTEERLQALRSEVE